MPPHNNTTPPKWRVAFKSLNVLWYKPEQKITKVSTSTHINLNTHALVDNTIVVLEFRHKRVSVVSCLISYMTLADTITVSYRAN